MGRWKRNHDIFNPLATVWGSPYERTVRNRILTTFHTQVEVIEAGTRSHGSSGETELLGRFRDSGDRNEWASGLHIKI